MATGRLGAEDLSATTLTTVYTCPADTYSIVSVNVCNRGSVESQIRLAIADTDTPDLSEYIEYNFKLGSANVIERTGLVLSASQRIVAYSDTTNISVVAVGIETTV